MLLTESATITHAIIPPDARKNFVSVRKMTAYKLGLGVIVASIQVPVWTCMIARLISPHSIVHIVLVRIQTQAIQSRSHA